MSTPFFAVRKHQWHPLLFSVTAELIFFPSVYSRLETFPAKQQTRI
jgi:hypothetical protein